MSPSSFITVEKKSMFLLSGVYGIKIYVKNVKAAYPLYTLLAQILMLKSLIVI